MKRKIFTILLIIIVLVSVCIFLIVGCNLFGYIFENSIINGIKSNPTENAVLVHLSSSHQEITDIEKEVKEKYPADLVEIVIGGKGQSFDPSTYKYTMAINMDNTPYYYYSEPDRRNKAIEIVKFVLSKYTGKINIDVIDIYFSKVTHYPIIGDIRQSKGYSFTIDELR